MIQHYFSIKRKFITIDQASKYYALPKSVFEDLISDREIPYYESMDKQYLLKIKEVNSWLTTKRIDTNAEMQAKQIQSAKDLFG